jgi:hypothetical protein
VVERRFPVPSGSTGDIVSHEAAEVGVGQTVGGQGSRNPRDLPDDAGSSCYDGSVASNVA